MKMTGAVVIGRNEGERLKICLNSISKLIERIVYVDSGSTDGSVTFAKDMGVDIVELDMSIPFTAARARNEGFYRLKGKYPEIEFVQFVDGDCEIFENWLIEAHNYLQENSVCACVCGILKERYPEKTIYNRICDIEWNGPIGNIDSCGGIFMARSEAYLSVGGMNKDIIAGEEPEFCLRLRKKKWKIIRINVHMGFHDAAMLKITQWWKRTYRSGYAFMLGYILHGKDHSHYYRQVISSFLWGGLLPLFILISSITISPTCIIFILLYLMLFLKIYFNLRKEKKESDSVLYSFHCVMAKIPQFFGCFSCLYKKHTRKVQTIIEYRKK